MTLRDLALRRAVAERECYAEALRSVDPELFATVHAALSRARLAAAAAELAAAKENA